MYYGAFMLKYTIFLVALLAPLMAYGQGQPTSVKIVPEMTAQELIRQSILESETAPSESTPEIEQVKPPISAPEKNSLKPASNKNKIKITKPAEIKKTPKKKTIKRSVKKKKIKSHQRQNKTVTVPFPKAKPNAEAIIKAQAARPIIDHIDPRYIPAGTIITRDLALRAALEVAPPARGFLVYETVYKERPAFQVEFKTENGPHDVLVDKENGRILKR